ncbi:MAG TPA: N-acetylmuramoyl-L-alanine amidase [Phycisphaerae bacterium]|nr:hypothetical protein [Phycisphaerae bacterium]HOB74938.1 N-acetylmuramoyl-L-alanine amidase [Phycisphaerae bacterium]HOJ56098.1 N-acetylmuramoyl-L-alanine amidase [Phycisphaerae bacterium]HOL25785.1 N-acetylmuramoyl-L-alanine amidase [Phycisphaerae bacterium]HPP19522.1 N-acetylmuramoyl-L-alanine amidase [Phycisphaerae bacterium]
MSISRSLFCTLVFGVLVTTAQAGDVTVFFWKEARLQAVTRQMPDELPAAQAALEALTAGPTSQEQTQGLTSSIPAGTQATVKVSDGQAVVDFSAQVIGGDFSDEKLEAIYRQVSQTLWSTGFKGNVSLQMGGASLASFLPPVPDIEPAPRVMQPQAVQPAAAGSALAGKVISLSPGHGLRWGGSSWAYERPVYCAPLSREDHHTVDLMAYLNTYLTQDGATTKDYRCLDKTYGTYSVSGQPWWMMSASYWLQHKGYPCSVYGSLTGCTLGSGSSESDDSLRSRGLASNHDNATLYVSMHTNGYQGDCEGSGCPNGTCTYYDAGSSHSQWGTISRNLATAVNNNIVSVIRTHYGDSTWRDRGAIDANGGFAETRIPTRAAILIELAFHDSCSRDGLYLQDNFFRSVTTWAVYKGICQYLGTTPTFDIYSSEYVSDTIPSEMTPNKTYSVSVTLRNRGVLWTDAQAFRLGAVGDSDPFTSTTRVSVTGEVNTGATYTFNFSLKAPAAAGTYTTDWRMVRDGFSWFGATVSRQVVVRYPTPPGDFDEDWDVDQDDFGYFQACMSGLQPQNDPNCQKAKLNGDDYVDGADLAIFRRCMTAAGVPASLDCAETP